jgi:hypothetical protein
MDFVQKEVFFFSYKIVTTCSCKCCFDNSLGQFCLFHTIDEKETMRQEIFATFMLICNDHLSSQPH